MVDDLLAYLARQCVEGARWCDRHHWFALGDVCDWLSDMCRDVLYR